MTAAELRERIAAVLMTRDLQAVAMLFDSDVPTIEGDVRRAMAATPDSDLAAVASIIGLDADGSDPRAEVDRLRAAIDDAAATLDGEHIAPCARSESRYAHCDCVIGRVRFALTKAVSQ